MKAWTIKTHRFTRKVEVNSLDYYSFTYEGTWVYLTLIQNWFECTHYIKQQIYWCEIRNIKKTKGKIIFLILEANKQE